MRLDTLFRALLLIYAIEFMRWALSHGLRLIPPAKTRSETAWRLWWTIVHDVRDVTGIAAGRK